jgi:uncharacterized tellurite resistance protein B-like protein
MNLKTLNEQPRLAFLDLLVLGMYSDGHLAAVEEAKIRDLLGEMGVEADSDRDLEIDTAVTRVRKHTSSSESAREYAASLARVFQAKDQRRQVLDRLNDLLASDKNVTASESTFAAVVVEALRL